MQPELNISSLLRSLAAAGVDFVVIGGVAVIAHGYERNTKDLDICLSRPTLPTSRHSHRIRELTGWLLDNFACARTLPDRLATTP